MIILLFGFWLLLNGRWTTEIAVTGAVLCCLLYLFMWKFLAYSPRREWRYIRRAGHAIAYIGWLVGEVLRSALAVIRLIWNPQLRVEQKLVGFDSQTETEAGRTVHANSITLTPGTVTVAVRGKRLLVHCLDEDFAELADSEMEQRLLRAEGVRKDG